ncbi:hypothetical protein [Spiroplasma endosymbiont of Virgichneumon dumeticola]|uniref:hypothetical protein n=1 Tax=Spiroplasma endosymbiont of Virgichneumon dumeticola TaxID=3139323 RepID=UPI0035C8F747
MPIEIENNTMIEEMIEQLKKTGVFAMSSFAQTILQSLISMRVAQTKWSWNNFKTSCKYSVGITMSETFLESKKFQWISNIKSWIYSKSNQHYQTEVTNLQFGISMFGYTATSIFQSYCSVLLDKLSNNKFETFFDLDILESTVTDLFFTIAIEIFEEKIIEILKENIKKFETNKNEINDLNDSKSQDIESDSIKQEELENISTSSDSGEEAKLLDVETKKVSHKSLLLTLPLSFLISTTFTWLNESFNNRADINIKKLLTDSPYLLLYNLDSLLYSLVNCIVNGDELPLFSLFKNCTKNNSITDNADFTEVVTQINDRKTIPIKENIKKCNSYSNLKASKETIRERSATI